MKVCHTSDIFTFQKTLILQLQVTLELSQFQELLSIYTDFLLLFAEYPSLFKFFKNEPNSLQRKNALFKNRFITSDPVRDGVNFHNYCNGNPLTRIDKDGKKLELKFDKTTQSLTIEFTSNNKTEKWVWNNESVTSRVEWGQENRNKHENSHKLQGNKTKPTQFPNGDWNITGIAETGNSSYGDFWLMTDAYQYLESYENDLTTKQTDKDGKIKYKKDTGYYIHYIRNTSNTLGCLGITNKQKMKFLNNLYRINKKTEDTTAVIHVVGHEILYSPEKEVEEYSSSEERK